MARMSIDDKVLRDPRITALAQALNWTRRETLGCLISEVWSICYDQATPLVSERMIDLAADCVGFAKAMIECELASRDHSGKVLIKGAKERIKYLDKKKGSGRLGGLKSAESRSKDVKHSDNECSSTGASTYSDDAQARGNPNTNTNTPANAPDDALGDTSGKPDDSPLSDPAALLAETAVFQINQIAGTQFQADSKSTRKLCRALVKAKHTPDEARAVIAAKRSWLSDPKMRAYFVPGTLLALANFEKYLDEIAGKQKPQRVQVANVVDDFEPMPALPPMKGAS